MKARMFLVLAIVLFASLAFAGAPPPFDKAKEYALKMPMQDDSHHAWEFSKSSNGEKVKYALVYFPQTGVILIVRDVVVFAYCEKTGDLKAAMFTVYGFVGINKSVAEITDFAFAVFRELVDAGAL